MADDAEKLWVTQREAITKKWDAGEPNQGKPKPYIVSTKPLFSTVTMVGEIVSPADPASDKYAFLVFRKQTLTFFEYGIGSSVSFGADSRKALPSDTNISKPKQTNGSADFVIEGLSLHCARMRATDSESNTGALAPFPLPGDTDVDAAIQGKRPVADPGSIFLVPQQYSPFNLENALLQSVLGSLAIDIAWDTDRFERIGTGFYLPQGGAGSELRSNGVPLATNVAMVKEGYLWARTGQTDSELVVNAVLGEACVIPITLNDNPDNSAEVCLPSAIYMDLVVKLHGFEFKYPSGN